MSYKLRHRKLVNHNAVISQSHNHEYTPTRTTWRACFGGYLTGDTRKIFVRKTVDESNSARVLIGCKPINTLQTHRAALPPLRESNETSVGIATWYKENHATTIYYGVVHILRNQYFGNFYPPPPPSSTVIKTQPPPPNYVIKAALPPSPPP